MSFRELSSKFPGNWEGSIEICCEPKLDNIKNTLNFIDQNPKVWAAFGVHPHYSDNYTDEVESHLLEAMKHPKTVAWGEMGLDYHYEYSPRDAQKAVFERQLKCAVKCSKPLVIHIREAEEDAIRIMQKLVPASYPIHCWSNMYIGFTGVITFAKQLEKTVSSVPLNRILLETDAPFMTPLPHRGEVCHSGYIPLIAKKVADIKGLSLDSVYLKTRKNTTKVYQI
uniref:TatD related DNase n=1 Tax=Arcella intermedia TaxID=1963864 RepID=A0A6B2LFR1_9EUKA